MSGRDGASYVYKFTATLDVYLGLTCASKVSKAGRGVRGDEAGSQIDISCIHIHCYTGSMSKACMSSENK